MDGTPIRVFKNFESSGVPYPNSQAMRIYCSLWDADNWATRGGLVKTDWTQAPFIASFTSFSADACVWSSGTSSCSTGSGPSNNSWMSQAPDTTGQERLTWVRNNYMIYDYCKDTKRFPQGLPAECSLTWLLLNGSNILCFSINSHSLYQLLSMSPDTNIFLSRVTKPVKYVLLPF